MADHGAEANWQGLISERGSDSRINLMVGEQSPQPGGINEHVFVSFVVTPPRSILIADK